MRRSERCAELELLKEPAEQSAIAVFVITTFEQQYRKHHLRIEVGAFTAQCQLISQEVFSLDLMSKYVFPK